MSPLYDLFSSPFIKFCAPSPTIQFPPRLGERTSPTHHSPASSPTTPGASCSSRPSSTQSSTTGTWWQAPPGGRPWPAAAWSTRPGGATSTGGTSQPQCHPGLQVPQPGVHPRRGGGGGGGGGGGPGGHPGGRAVRPGGAQQLTRGCKKPSPDKKPY